MNPGAVIDLRKMHVGDPSMSFLVPLSWWLKHFSFCFSWDQLKKRGCRFCDQWSLVSDPPILDSMFEEELWTAEFQENNAILLGKENEAVGLKTFGW